MSAQIAIVLLLLGAVVVAVLRRRAKLACWFLVMLVIVLVAEGTAMNNSYMYPTPRVQSSGCGQLGSGC